MSNILIANAHCLTYQVLTSFLETSKDATKLLL